MRTIARRRSRGARPFAALGALLFAALLLAACGADTPHLSSLAPAQAGSQPLQQATANPTPEAPTTHGNATSSGSFGAGTNSLALPTAAPPAPTKAPPAPIAAPATAPAAVATAVPAAPANPEGATTQAHPPATPKIDVRWRLLYAGPDGKLWSVGRDGKDPQVVLDKPAGDTPPGRLINLNLSPAGNRLLYNIAGAPGARVFLLDLTSGALSTAQYNGAWAADNRHVVISKNNQLAVVDVTNPKGAEEALGEGSNPNWTADNQIIAVRQGNIWLIPYPVSSGTPKPLTHLPATGAGAWSFVNLLQYQYTNRVLFAGAPAGSQNATRIRALDIPAQKLTDLVPPSGADVRYLALSPSGMYLAVAEQVQMAACANAGMIQILRATGGAAPIQVNIPHADTDYFFLRGITWSPDQWLAYSGVEQSCAGGQVTLLTPDKIYLVNPAAPNAPQPFVNGTFPVWVAPRGLGLIDPGATALH